MNDEPNVLGEKLKESSAELKTSKLAMAQFDLNYPLSSSDPWSPDDVDKMDTKDSSKSFENYKKLVKECRFYYRKDPIGSSVINKLVEIGITDLVFDIGKLSVNELRIFEAIKKSLKSFAEKCALEYLITGLVVAEVKFEAKPSSNYKEFGLKKKTSINVPNMWVRDSSTIKMNSSINGDEPSYFAEIPDSLIWFIQNKGQYEDGTTDVQRYNDLLKLYPAFVEGVRNGQKQVLLEKPLAIRRKPMSDSPYPTPYFSSTIESFKHKRNMKRLDYSIAARAIGAIQQFAVGSDLFPVTADEEDVFENLKNQMRYRYSSNYRDLERIFQLFTNHTVKITWVYPPLEALLSETKYISVNEDIFFSLGFPKILTTGESGRSNSSDPEFASMSPVETMENMQEDILKILSSIIKGTAEQNGLTDFPSVRFEPISLRKFADFIAGLRNLYDTGNLSRTTFAGAFGYKFDEEAQQLKKDKEIMKEYGLDEFAPKPYSPQPKSSGGQDGQMQKQPESKQDSSPQTKEKVANVGENTSNNGENQ